LKKCLLYDVARVRVHGNPLVIVPMPSSFGRLNIKEWDICADAYREAANDAGFIGDVVVAWPGRNPRNIQALAPRRTHPLLKQMSFVDILMNINGQLPVVA